MLFFFFFFFFQAEDGIRDVAVTGVQTCALPIWALTKSPLTNPQIVALLKEIATPDAQKNLDAGKPATVAYVTADGAFVIRAMINGAKWHVVARIDPESEFRRLTSQFKAMDLPPEETLSQAPAAAAPAPRK